MGTPRPLSAVSGLITKMKDIKRVGFETTLRLSGPPAAIGAIHVEAISSDGRVLMVSEYVRPVPAYGCGRVWSEVMQLNESLEARTTIDDL